MMHIPGPQGGRSEHAPRRQGSALLRASSTTTRASTWRRVSLLFTRGPVPAGHFAIPLGVADVKRTGDDVTVITWGRQVHEALAAAERLAAEGIERRGHRHCAPSSPSTGTPSSRAWPGPGAVLIVHAATQFAGPGAEIAALVGHELFGELACAGRAAGRRCTRPSRSPPSSSAGTSRTAPASPSGSGPWPGVAPPPCSASEPGRVVLRIPQAAVTMTEGTIVEWVAAEGGRRRRWSGRLPARDGEGGDRRREPACPASCIQPGRWARATRWDRRSASSRRPDGWSGPAPGCVSSSRCACWPHARSAGPATSTHFCRSWPPRRPRVTRCWSSAPRAWPGRSGTLGHPFHGGGEPGEDEIAPI